MEEDKDWDKLLPYLLFAYREVSQEPTGFSPFMAGRFVAFLMCLRNPGPQMGTMTPTCATDEREVEQDV